MGFSNDFACGMVVLERWALMSGSFPVAKGKKWHSGLSLSCEFGVRQPHRFQPVVGNDNLSF